jgi:hypothetical protein
LNRPQKPKLFLNYFAEREFVDVLSINGLRFWSESGDRAEYLSNERQNYDNYDFHTNEIGRHSIHPNEKVLQKEGMEKRPEYAVPE